jgi:hypothetical protein
LPKGCPAELFSARLFSSNRITYLREILRADLNHDGIEEILISCYHRAVGGTLGFGHTAMPTTIP